MSLAEHNAIWSWKSDQSQVELSDTKAGLSSSEQLAFWVREGRGMDVSVCGLVCSIVCSTVEGGARRDASGRGRTGQSKQECRRGCSDGLRPVGSFHVPGAGAVPGVCLSVPGACAGADV